MGLGQVQRRSADGGMRCDVNSSNYRYVIQAAGAVRGPARARGGFDAHGIPQIQFCSSAAVPN